MERNGWWFIDFTLMSSRLLQRFFAIAMKDDMR